MDSRLLNNLSREWLGFTPELLTTIESWSGPRGIIFISQDASSSVAASCLAKAVGGTLFRYDGDRGAQWKASLDQIQAGLRSDGLFQSRALCVCVLVEGLDDKPKWLLNRLDDFMSAQPAGCLVLASARNSGDMPHRLAAMFVRLKKEDAQVREVSEDSGGKP